jgi:hypothetical protein
VEAASSVAVEAEAPAPGPDQTLPPDDEDHSAKPVPERQRLFELNGTPVDASLIEDDAPLWHLPVNGLVIPVGVRAGFEGKLAKALQRPLGDPLWKELRERVQATAGTKVDPFDPVHVSLEDPDLGPALLPNAPQLPPGKGLNENGEQVRYHVIAATAGNLAEVEQLQHVAEAVVRTAASHGVWRLAFSTLGTGAGPFADQGQRAGAYMVRGVYDALLSLPEGALGEIILTTRHPDTIEAMRVTANALVNTIPQSLVSDEPEWRDLLGIQTEVDALAEALLLEGVEPPLSVGILGGWGCGKSSVMNLMRQRMQQIRGYASPGWPDDVSDWGERTYVGHPYLICFNAWTYAKANLWASLMQTVFVELNHQLTLETTLIDTLVEPLLEAEGFPPLKENEIASPEREKRKAELAEPIWLTANDLWSALLYAGEEERRLLTETKIGAEVLYRWQTKQVSTDALWTYLQRQTQKEMERLEELREQLAQERAKLAARAAWSPVLTQLQGVLVDPVLKQIEQEVGEGNAQALADLAEMTPDLRSVLDSMLRQPLNTLVITLFAAIGVAVPYLLNLVQWPPWVGVALTAAIAFGQQVLRLQARLNKVHQEYWTGYESELARLEAGRTQLFDLPELRELSASVVQLEAQVRQQEERIGLTSRCRSLRELVQSRLDEGYYEQRLGLMHRVECDLDELTGALYIRRHDHPDTIEQKRQLFPRGQPRVVLFIDDLDRCPPDRVVEVLEAVQLLLKTKLFVVVLGLDTRYVTRALEKAYEGILMAQGEPSGLDYIEKIIALPYRVHKVAPEMVARFLAGQKMEVLAEEPAPAAAAGDEREGREREGGDQVLGEPDADLDAPDRPEERAPQKALSPQAVTFSPLEYETIRTTCQEVELTPRSLKRISNVMKLIKIFWHRAGIPAERVDVQVVVGLLALSAQYPEVMRDAFEALDARHSSEEDNQSLTWPEFFEEFVPAHRARNPHLDVQALEFLDDAWAVMPDQIAIGAVDAVHIRLARSFSFVGDPTSPVAPATKVELVARQDDGEPA